MILASGLNEGSMSGNVGLPAGVWKGRWVCPVFVFFLLVQDCNISQWPQYSCKAQVSSGHDSHVCELFEI